MHGGRLARGYLTSERQPSRNEADGIPDQESISSLPDANVGRGIPDTKKINFDMDTKRFLEGGGLLPPEHICTSVLLVREGNLLMAANWQDADLADHAS